jgi:hypothetical protein
MLRTDMVIGVTNLGELLCATSIVAFRPVATRLFEGSNEVMAGHEPSLRG